MIFAYATDGRALMVFPDETQAIAYCEGIDVEEGNWQFFNDNGKPLEAVFITPNKYALLLNQYEMHCNKKEIVSCL